ncbi:hypothetical protein [Sphingobacterium sp. UBA6645]|uniref:hypothetical protein n=1 Tax=Sphingobacterium sp. UBA6645 TaxID=1947511 RepID=UPI0025DFE270|nr:hypothetical protein [Sphingobacterium sp. UBA6645]
MASLAGKLLRVKFNDKYIKCQLDASLNFTNTFDEEGECKPEETTEVAEGTWVTRVLESQDHSITVNYRLFLDALGGASIGQADLVQLNIDGQVYGEAEWLTTPGQHSEANNQVIVLPVVISTLGLEAPATGRANGTLELLGNGKPTQSILPVA